MQGQIAVRRHPGRDRAGHPVVDDVQRSSVRVGRRRAHHDRCERSVGPVHEHLAGERSDRMGARVAEVEHVVAVTGAQRGDAAEEDGPAVGGEAVDPAVVAARSLAAPARPHRSRACGIDGVEPQQDRTIGPHVREGDRRCVVTREDGLVEGADGAGRHAVLVLGDEVRRAAVGVEVELLRLARQRRVEDPAAVDDHAAEVGRRPHQLRLRERGVGHGNGPRQPDRIGAGPPAEEVRALVLPLRGSALVVGIHRVAGGVDRVREVGVERDDLRAVVEGADPPAADQRRDEGLRLPAVGSALGDVVAADVRDRPGEAAVGVEHRAIAVRHHERHRRSDHLAALLDRRDQLVGAALRQPRRVLLRADRSVGTVVDRLSGRCRSREQHDRARRGGERLDQGHPCVPPPEDAPGLRRRIAHLSP